VRREDSAVAESSGKRAGTKVVARCNSECRDNPASSSPFAVLLDAFSNAERGDLADERQWQRLFKWKLDRPSRGHEFRKRFREGAYCRRRWIEADVIFVRGECDQYPPIGKRRHTPLQAFRGSGRGFADARVYFTQFLLSLFWSGVDVPGDVFRPRFFCTHDFLNQTFLSILVLSSLSELRPSR
jgi:hypothetical protein